MKQIDILEEQSEFIEKNLIYFWCCIHKVNLSVTASFQEVEHYC